MNWSGMWRRSIWKSSSEGALHGAEAGVEGFVEMAFLTVEMRRLACCGKDVTIDLFRYGGA